MCVCVRFSLELMRTFGCRVRPSSAWPVQMVSHSIWTPFRLIACRCVCPQDARVHTYKSLVFLPFLFFAWCIALGRRFCFCSWCCCFFCYTSSRSLSLARRRSLRWSVRIIFPKSLDNLSMIRFIFKIQVNGFDARADSEVFVIFFPPLMSAQSEEKTMVGISQT